jgi:hypothetical protein
LLVAAETSAASTSRSSRRCRSRVLFVERLIGTIRRECLGRTFFWTAPDLETKLLSFSETRRARDTVNSGG